MLFFVKSAKYVACTLFIAYTAFPICIYIFPIMHHHFLFMNMVKWPYTNYSNPRRLGVQSACRNFFLETDKNIKLGVWHILPNSLNNTPISDESDYEKLLSTSNKRIIVYFHGNAWTRSAPHRIKLYNIFSAADYHVLALDYRGYGDSSGTPSEKGVIHDAMKLFTWVKERSGENPVFIWSHSLGTAIGTAATKRLCKQNLCPNGFVLEAPFNNLGSIVRHHAITKPFRWMPWFEKIMVEPFEHLGIYFTTDERIKFVECPILILHAKDDRVIPFKLAENLRDVALDNGRDVSFVEYEANLNYGHKYICDSPDFLKISTEFFDRCLSSQRTPA